MSFLQGEALPNITTTQGQTTTAPSWYTDYLSNLAQQGSTAAANANYVGAQPLQQQAFTNVAQNVGNYQPGLTAATNLAEAAGQGSALAAANPYLQAASQTAPSVIGNYMNPYTQNVVSEIGRLGQQNIAQNLAPGATAGAVGSGQFGSRRGAQVDRKSTRLNSSH